MVEAEEDAQRYYRGVANRKRGHRSENVRLEHKPSHDIAISVNTFEDFLQLFRIQCWMVEAMRNRDYVPEWEDWDVEDDSRTYHVYRFLSPADAALFKMTLIDDDVTDTLLE